MMKKNNLLIGIMLALSMSVAQAQIDNPLTIGAKGGVNFNQFSQPGTTVGGQIGGFVYFSPINLVAVQAELLYDLQGGGRQNFSWELDLPISVDSAYSDDDYYMTSPFAVFSESDLNRIRSLDYYNRSVHLHTLSLPISVRIKPINSTNVKLAFLIGGSLDYIWSAFEVHDVIYTFEDGTSVMLSDERENVSADLDDLQGSIHLGAVLDFALDNGRNLSYEVRYRKSFSDLNKKITNITVLTEELRTHTVSFSIYYPIF